MRSLVTSLASKECAGRAPGTAGGLLARGLVVDALREAGLDPHEQPIERGPGANVLATLPGEVDRWIMIAAHYDHLGVLAGEIYPGADDNAAAVGILATVARGLADRRPDGRGVIIAAFDAEEPPAFMTQAMGSEHWARHPSVPLDHVDLMVCMDLVGHTLGPAGVPDEVRNTVFALGSERSAGTAADVDTIAEAEAGVIVRRVDAEIIPPLSDYWAFWQRRRPFMLLTNARSRIYHTPEDTTEHLAWDKMDATARWLERFVRMQCARDTEFTFRERRDDVSTLDSMIALTETLARVSPDAKVALGMARELRGRCGAGGAVPDHRQTELQMIVAGLESALA